MNIPTQNTQNSTQNPAIYIPRISEYTEAITSVMRELKNIGASPGEIIGFFSGTPDPPKSDDTGSMAISLCVFIVIYGRMIEIYMTCSIAPIPFSTMVNKEWGHIGNSYLKSLFALAFQGFLIMVCVAIYAVLLQSITASSDVHAAIWGCAGYTVLLCFTLFKTGSLSKAIFGAH